MSNKYNQYNKKNRSGEYDILYILKIKQNYDFCPNELTFFKLSRTKMMTKLDPSQTIQIVKKLYVRHIDETEAAIISRMSGWLVRYKQKYFYTTYSILINEIAEYIKISYGEKIDKYPDIEVGKECYNFDPNKPMLFKIVNDLEDVKGKKNLKRK